MYPPNLLTLTLEILGCGREMIHELSIFKKSIFSNLFLTEKRHALNLGGFNSNEPMGPVFLTGWLAVDQSVRNTGYEDIRGILDYAHKTLLQICTCN